MLVYLELITDLGTFRGPKIEVNDSEYSEMVDMSKNYSSHGGFEMYLDDDSFLVLSSGVLNNSILLIRVC